jgi:hypothetical protein
MKSILSFNLKMGENKILVPEGAKVLSVSYWEWEHIPSEYGVRVNFLRSSKNKSKVTKKFLVTFNKKTLSFDDELCGSEWFFEKFGTNTPPKIPEKEITFVGSVSVKPLIHWDSCYGKGYFAQVEFFVFEL